jgi:hypothetical protein
MEGKKLKVKNIQKVSIFGSGAEPGDFEESLFRQAQQPSEHSKESYFFQHAVIKRDYSLCSE